MMRLTGLRPEAQRGVDTNSINLLFSPCRFCCTWLQPGKGKGGLEADGMNNNNTHPSPFLPVGTQFRRLSNQISVNGSVNVSEEYTRKHSVEWQKAAKKAAAPISNWNSLVCSHHSVLYHHCTMCSLYWKPFAEPVFLSALSF